MSADDTALGKLLQERGLLSLEEFAEAEVARRETGKPLADVLVEKSLLSPVQVEDALAALHKRVRFCPECKVPVFVTRLMAEGERCPRCLGPVVWHEESQVEQIRDIETIVQLTKDELPPEVQAARTIPGRLFGKYVLLQEVGKGGAGVVYKAWDTMLADYVALKFIRDRDETRRVATSSKESAKQRQEQILDLLQEARAALRLRHEHIVAVRDIGRIEKQYYIAMDFVEGRTLADHIHDSQSRGYVSPLYERPAFFLGMMRDVANALHYAHTFPKPIVHCDLKPGNVLVAKNGVAFVMDFGLARALGQSRTEENDDKVRGTPAYMAPEQLSGKYDAISVRTDVYAIGATLYELLAGRPVFVGEPLSILVQAMRNQPERPTDVVRKAGPKQTDSTKVLMKISRLEEVCLKCLSREPKDRYGSARDVAEELSTVIEAIGSGKEDGMVPDRVLQAQARSELHEIDARITRFDLAQAMAETRELERKRDTTWMRRRIEDRRHQVALLEEFRGRLVSALNTQRPRFPEFALDSELLRDAEVMKATVKKIYLLVGESPRELEWARLPAAQVASMAEAVSVTGHEDRLALGILCHHARLVPLARKYLTSLDGTPLENQASAILASTA